MLARGLGAVAAATASAARSSTTAAASAFARLRGFRFHRRLFLVLELLGGGWRGSLRGPAVLQFVLVEEPDPLRLRLCGRRGGGGRRALRARLLRWPGLLPRLWLSLRRRSLWLGLMLRLGRAHVAVAARAAVALRHVESAEADEHFFAQTAVHGDQVREQADEQRLEAGDEKHGSQDERLD